MVTTPAQPASRYRRRILALGVLATGALYVIGAPIFADRIESDLESRVPSELSDAGFVGITASFSGQDGTLTCTAPLDDPEAARAAAFDVHGVRTVDLDRSCRVNTSAALDDEGATDTAADQQSSDDMSGDETSSGEADADSSDSDNAPATTASEDSLDAETDLAPIEDVVAANPDLAFLSVLLADIDLGRSDGLATLFAPSNAAFDAVPADVLSQLQNDSELLARVLEHHVVDGVVMSDDLVDGEITAADGAPLTVVVGDEITVGGVKLTETDIVASNGVVHVVDAVLVPADLLDGAPDEQAAVVITYDGEQMIMAGIAASEVERQLLLEAAVDAVGLEAVVDETTVDPDVGVDTATVIDLAALVRAMPANLLSGEAGFDGTELFATGAPRSAIDRDAFIVLAVTVGVSANLSEPPPVEEPDPADLEAQLNAFVVENPILFEPSSDTLAESASVVLDRIAADVLAFGDLSVTVEGHTDSDGIPIENLQLSQNRAEAVRDALIERGLLAEAIEAVGFGSEQPVLVDGAEDKSASRRVEFRLAAAA